MSGDNMIPLFKVYMNDNACSEVNKVLTSGYVAQGPKTDEFEKLIQTYLLDPVLGQPLVVTVNSCTSALHLAYHLIKTHHNLPDDTEVLSTPVTCAATNLPILHNRMKIKWCDVDNNLNIDLDDIRYKWTENTRILSFVHWGGHPIDLDKVAQLKQKYLIEFGKELFVVEDAAHAWGSTFLDNLKIGFIDPENYVCFSFQAIKNLTCGDGGCLVTPNQTYKYARLLRWFGIDRDNGSSFRHGQDIKVPGYKFHMNDVSAAIGIANFYGSLDSVKIQKENAKFYSQRIQNDLIKKTSIKDSSCWLYTLLVDDANRFIEHMKDRGIECNKVHSRNDKLSVFKEFDRNDVPNVDRLENKRCCIPVGRHLTKYNLQTIVDACNEYC